jgi:hypothetical protein
MWQRNFPKLLPKWPTFLVCRTGLFAGAFILLQFPRQLVYALGTKNTLLLA